MVAASLINEQQQLKQTHNIVFSLPSSHHLWPCKHHWNTRYGTSLFNHDEALDVDDSHAVTPLSFVFI